MFINGNAVTTQDAQQGANDGANDDDSTTAAAASTTTASPPSAAGLAVFHERFSPSPVGSSLLHGLRA